MPELESKIEQREVGCHRLNNRSLTVAALFGRPQGIFWCRCSKSLGRGFWAGEIVVWVEEIVVWVNPEPQEIARWRKAYNRWGGYCLVV